MGVATILSYYGKLKIINVMNLMNHSIEHERIGFLRDADSAYLIVLNTFNCDCLIPNQWL